MGTAGDGQGGGPRYTGSRPPLSLNIHRHVTTTWRHHPRSGVAAASDRFSSASEEEGPGMGRRFYPPLLSAFQPETLAAMVFYTGRQGSNCQHWIRIFFGNRTDADWEKSDTRLQINHTWTRRRHGGTRTAGPSVADGKPPVPEGSSCLTREERRASISQLGPAVPDRWWSGRSCC